MKIKEAIEMLERIVDENNDYGRQVLSDCAIAGIEEGIRALEKQVPREIGCHYSKFTKKMYDACPECGDRLRSDDEYHPNYCEFCGQALKWGEEE